MCFYFVCLTGSALALVLARGRHITLIALTVIGFMTWMAHGTASQLAQLFPAYGMVHLQAGMQLTGVAVFILVLYLQIDSVALETADVGNFYTVALCITSVGGILCGVFLWCNRQMLDTRDVKMTPSSAPCHIGGPPTSDLSAK